MPEPEVVAAVEPAAEPVVAPDVTPSVDPAEAPEPSSESKPWYDGVGEMYQGHPSLDKFESAAAAAEAYINLEKMQGKSIRIPDKDAGVKAWKKFEEKISGVSNLLMTPRDPDDAEAWNKLFTKLGRPETPDAYGDDIDEDKANLYHNLGLSQTQVRELQTQAKKDAKAATEALNATSKENSEKLKELWGDGFNRNMQNALIAMNQFGGAEFVEEVKNNPALGDLPALFEVFTEVGKVMADKGIPITSEPGNFNMTPAEINDRVSTLMKHEGYGEEQWITDELTTLYKAKYPEEKVANG